MKSLLLLALLILPGCPKRPHAPKPPELKIQPYNADDCNYVSGIERNDCLKRANRTI